MCIQALNYPDVLDDVIQLARAIHSSSTVPISVSCPPFSKSQLKKLAEAGVNRVGISLDASTEELFDKVKGALTNSSYKWQEHRKALLEAVEVFGKKSSFHTSNCGIGGN